MRWRKLLWEAHLDLVLINRKGMGKILMVVDNLNENHHKVIEFMILGRERWQYHKTLGKKKVYIDFKELQELVSSPLGNLFYADRSTEDLEAPREPVQRAEALLDSNFYSQTVLIASQ